MNNSEYIRAAVKLASGWGIDNQEDGDAEYDYLSQAGDMAWHLNEDPMWVHDIPNLFIDALAAQLVRQVDRVDGHDIFIEPTCVKIGESMRPGSETILFGATRIDGPDRTMNTIKVIIDYKVLEDV